MSFRRTVASVAAGLLTVAGLGLSAAPAQAAPYSVASVSVGQSRFDATYAMPIAEVNLDIRGVDWSYEYVGLCATPVGGPAPTSGETFWATGSCATWDVGPDGRPPSNAPLHGVLPLPGGTDSDWVLTLKVDRGDAPLYTLTSAQLTALGAPAKLTTFTSAAPAPPKNVTLTVANGSIFNPGVGVWSTWEQPVGSGALAAGWRITVSGCGPYEVPTNNSGGRFYWQYLYARTYYPARYSICTFTIRAVNKHGVSAAVTKRGLIL